MTFLEALGWAVLVLAVAGRLTRRIKTYRCNGLLAVAFGFWTLDDIVQQDWLWALYQSGLTALEIWLWWRGGGGDDTKRRLRQLRQAFTPVRRTAPAVA